jgi:hypothetical protein
MESQSITGKQTMSNHEIKYPAGNLTGAISIDVEVAETAAHVLEGEGFVAEALLIYRSLGFEDKVAECEARAKEQR